MHKKKYKLTGRRIAILLLTFVMVFSFTLGQMGLDGTTFSVSASTDSDTSDSSGSATVTYSNVTGSYDTSAIKAANFSSSVMSGSSTAASYETRTVIVSLEGESILEAADGEEVSDYLDTSAGRKTERSIQSLQQSFLNKLSGLGITYSEVYSYSVVDNAVAIEVNTSYVSRIKNIDGVESVVIGDTYEALESVDDSTATSGSATSTSDITNETNVYATGIYDSSEYLEKYGGRGMTVAILDTGLDYTHEAFQISLDDPDSDFYVGDEIAFTEQEISQIMSDSSKDFNAAGDVYVSSKVPFAYDYADKDTDVYPSYSNHGTHVAGIIGGYASSYTDKDGNVAVDEDTGETLEFWGVAPYCQLVICKVFTDDLTSEDIGGARTEDILAALEDCVTLGVDVINMSLGTTCGFSTTDDGDPEGEYMAAIYQAVADADISLIAAASNDYSSGYGSTFGTNLTSNPDSGTVGSPSTYSGALSVASISGKTSSYMIANSGTDNEYSVFFQESSDENSVDYDFLEQMLVDDEGDAVTHKEIAYVVIGGVGLASDYSTTIKNKLSELQAQGYVVAALIKRGNSTFQEKVEVAMSYGFDAVIVYNNVAGEIKMTIGDVENPVPTISITQEAGEAMVSGATSRVGYLTLDSNYAAGPFMSSFSSWGVTSDLKLKPEITAHGGEITSAVPGGWTEMSGTSMATPNVAGLTANVRNYLSSTDLFGTISSYSQLTSQLMMSTATLVVDQEGLLYSPRKQGAGLASLDNIINTKAYLWTDSSETYTSAHGTYTGADNNLPKIEIGDDDDKVGEYMLVFYYTNCSSSSQSFTLKSYFMTETVSLDGYAVGEQAYYLNGNAVWTINGKDYSDGDTVTLGTGDTMITCTLTLTDEEREYLDSNFENGMYVEGFLKLISTDYDNQCDLSIPFLGFYGDWESAPMLDYTAFEIAEIEQDTSIDDDEKPSESVWATQAYSSYWNGDYVLPMGSYLYTQDEDADQIYTSEEHTSVSCYNDYYGLNDGNNYMTSYEIRGLYAGLLRNARKVTLELTDCATGEVLYETVVYRVNKAYASSGSVTPGFVKMYLSPDELGLVENGQYHITYKFYFQEDSEPDEDDTYEFSFYVDYTAPILESASVRYVDYKDGNVTKQRIYLDLTVYDNHYSMAALLCRLTTNDSGEQALELATEYTTPIYNAVKNGSTTVSIEVTDLLNSSYATVLYLELDDYALNHSIYEITISEAKNVNAAGEFELADGEDEITIAKLATHTVSLEWDGTTYSASNLSNFTWSVRSGSSYVAVKNGTIVGLKAGTATVTVSNGTTTKQIKVTVTDSDTTLSYPSISFAAILNNYGAPVAASGRVEVYMDQEITLEIETDPWYYTLAGYSLDIEWKSYNESVAQVDENGNITMLKEGSATIEASIAGTAYSTSVTLVVEDPFTISNYSLTDYTGTNSVVYIPADSNIMYIGDEAFKNNTNIEVVIIPSTVTAINEQAFYGCTNLKYVFFDGLFTQDVPDSALTLIEDYAFYGCTSLEFVDCSNCLTFTASYYAFAGCTSLKFIKGIENMSTAYEGAFEGCTSLLGSLSEDYGDLVNSVTLTVDGNVDTSGFFYSYVVDYANHTITKYDGQTGEVLDETKLTESTFNITNIAIAIGAIEKADDIDTSKVKDLSDISSVNITDISLSDTVENFAKDVTTLDISGLHVSGDYVFAGCTSLTNITTAEFTSIGDYMFYGCTGLTGTVEINTSSIGDYAFYGCSKITNVVIDCGTSVDLGDGLFYNCGNLVSVDAASGTTIRSIGNYAFYNTGITQITLSDGLQSLGGNVFQGTTASIVIDTDLTNVSFTGSTFNYVNSSRLTVTSGSGLTKDSNGIITTSDGKTLVLVPYGYSGGELDLTGTSITKIGQYALASVNKSVSVKLPAALTEIGDGAFASSYVTAVTFADGTNNLTKIGSSAFYGSKITTITLPSSVTSVGSYAFAETPLTSFTFAPSGEAAFGNYVFAQCTSLKDIALADSITTMGSGTFYYCTNLETVTLPSVTSLGNFTFFGCTKLKSVAYGENATTTGSYTFYSYGGTYGSYTYDEYSSLTSLTLGGKITEIGEAAFMNLTALTSIDLKGATAIGEYAFYNCSALAAVTGLENVTEIGDYAFYNSKALTALNLAKAEVIGDYAFYNASNVTTISIPAAKTIGSFSFAGTAVTTVEIPETMLSWVAKDSETDWINWELSYTDGDGTTTDYSENSGTIYYEAIGDGAFAYSTALTSFTVASGSTNYKAIDGVLYRVTEDGGYILVAYPSAKAATSYTVIEDTVRVKAYSFAGASNLTDVTFEYTVTNIGVGAFYNSSVVNYTFLSVEAPVLEAAYSDREDITLVTPGYVSQYRGLYNTNFGTDLVYYLTDISVYDSNNSLVAASTSKLTMTYPSNGTGYTNYLYSNYFGTSTKGAVAMTDTTRELRATIESFGYTVSDVNGWLTLTVNSDNTQMVTDFSDLVKEAHRLYNIIKSDSDQLELLTDEYSQLIFDLEDALRDVKTRFGYTVKISSTKYDSESYRSTYVEGEKFDITGLTVTVTYDDYSTETYYADNGDITVVDPDAELDLYDSSVAVYIADLDKTVNVVVTVSEESTSGSGDNNDSDDTKTSGGCGSIAIGGGSGFTGLLIVLFVLAAFVVIRRRKISAK